MKNNEFLNVPSIQKEIHVRHQAFIKKYGGAIEKVMADHKLFSDIVTAKLSRILLVFKQEAIIDDIKIVEQGPYKKITLSKNGYDTYVVIETNGIEIAFQGYAYTSDMISDLALLRHKVRDVNTDDFDWVRFSIQLVEYIHKTIYERKEVVEAMLDGILRPIPFEGLEKAINERKSKKSKKQ